MKIILFIVFFNIMAFALCAQESEISENKYQNVADKLLSTDGKLVIGGYGEVHYNQTLSSTEKNNGILDVHRVVMLLGYNFNARTQFISELEFEHVNEVVVEQAFLQHKLNNYINLRAGLMLIPMGIVNEYHEPTAFNGVERPVLDTKLSPSTWREVGVGFSGNIIPASIKYQLYLVNGFSGYKNGAGTLNAKNGFRSGRQKGAESYMSSPNFTGKVEYYAIRGLNLGLSGYFGKTQSTLYNGLKKTNATAIAKADSSVTNISMIGVDARYNLGGLQMRGQIYYAGIGNTEQYNKFTAKNSVNNDLGSAMMGYYVEAGYNVFKFIPQAKTELIPFVRFENYDTQYATAGLLAKNKANESNLITTGLTYKLAKGVVLKADLQFSKSGVAAEYSKSFNAGFGVMF